MFSSVCRSESVPSGSAHDRRGRIRNVRREVSRIVETVRGRHERRILDHRRIAGAASKSRSSVTVDAAHPGRSGSTSRYPFDVASAHVTGRTVRLNAAIHDALETFRQLRLDDRVRQAHVLAARAAFAVG